MIATFDIPTLGLRMLSTIIDIVLLEILVVLPVRWPVLAVGPDKRQSFTLLRLIVMLMILLVELLRLIVMLLWRRLMAILLTKWLLLYAYGRTSLMIVVTIRLIPAPLATETFHHEWCQPAPADNT